MKLEDYEVEVFENINVFETIKLELLDYLEDFDININILKNISNENIEWDYYLYETEEETKILEIFSKARRYRFIFTNEEFSLLLNNALRKNNNDLESDYLFVFKSVDKPLTTSNNKQNDFIVEEILSIDVHAYKNVENLEFDTCKKYYLKKE